MPESRCCARRSSVTEPCPTTPEGDAVNIPGGQAAPLTIDMMDHLLPRVRIGLQHLVIGLAAAFLAGCGWTGGDGWEEAVETQAGQLGYGNWIVIAEGSFPAHSRTGTRQIDSGEPIPVVLDEVLRTLERTEHVRPKVYVPLELESVENDFAPGIEQYRRELDIALHGHEVTRLEQESLMTLIQDTQRSLDVLVVRTDTALPYTSVFLELEPGYWDGESEMRLRDRMEKLSPPDR